MEARKSPLGNSAKVDEKDQKNHGRKIHPKKHKN
jgi:hypothetical protein